MDGLTYMVADRQVSTGDATFDCVDDAVQFYNKAKHMPVCAVHYRGVQVGTIDVDRLSAEVARSKVMDGHPRSY